MTVAELEKILSKVKDKNMDIFIRQNNDEYEYSLVDSVKPQMVKFSDDSGRAKATVKVLVITDY